MVGLFERAGRRCGESHREEIGLGGEDGKDRTSGRKRVVEDVEYDVGGTPARTLTASICTSVNATACRSREDALPVPPGHRCMDMHP